MRFINYLIRLLGGVPTRWSYQKYIYNNTTIGERRLISILKDFTKQELIELFTSSEQQVNNKMDWFKQYMVYSVQVERLTKTLRSKFTNDTSMNRAIHLSDLEEKNKKLKREIQNLTEINTSYKNDNYATGLIVRCTGCLAGKPLDGENLTEEKVKDVETIAKRIRTWYNNNKSRINNANS